MHQIMHHIPHVVLLEGAKSEIYFHDSAHLLSIKTVSETIRSLHWSNFSPHFKVITYNCHLCKFPLFDTLPQYFNLCTCCTYRTTSS